MKLLTASQSNYTLESFLNATSTLSFHLEDKYKEAPWACSPKTAPPLNYHYPALYKWHTHGLNKQQSQSILAFPVDKTEPSLYVPSQTQLWKLLNLKMRSALNILWALWVFGSYILRVCRSFHFLSACYLVMMLSFIWPEPRILEEKSHVSTSLSLQSTCMPF